MLCCTAAPAHAQQSTLAPFAWRASVALGTAGGRRPISDARFLVEASNTLPPLEATGLFLPDDPSTPDPTDVLLFAQLPRDVGGVRPHYALKGDGSPLPAFFLDHGTRVLTLALPAFDAPAAGDLAQTVRVDDLCALVFEVDADAPGDTFGGLFFSFQATGSPVSASFGVPGPPRSGSDPRGLEGYVVVSPGPAALAEILVPRSAAYVVRGTVLINGSAVDFGPLPPVAVDGACQLPPSSPPLSVKLPRARDGHLIGALWLRADPAPTPDAPVVAWYVMQAADAKLPASVQVENVAPVGDAAAAFDLGLPARTWLLAPQAGVTWPDGRTELLDLPRATDGGRWSPLVSLPALPQVALAGVYPDASVVLSAAETESALFEAPMAFAHGDVVLRGCATVDDLSDGTVELTGLSDGQGRDFTDERGRGARALTGNEGGRGRTPLVPRRGTFEFVGTPGAWTEATERLVLARDGGASGTGLQGEVQLSLDMRRLDLVPGRARAVPLHREVALGAVTVTLRVVNEDGSLRPFRHPAARIAGASLLDAASAPIGTFLALANESREAGTEQHVRLVAPPGTWDVELTAEVPEHPDGTGPFTVAPFPPMVRVPFRPPRADGSCDAICIDAQTGQYVGDDLQAPVVALDAPLPARTADETLIFGGLVSDESPVESLTVAGLDVALAGAPQDGSRRFRASVPLHEGDNTIDLVATDRCGEVRTVAFPVFHVVNHPPRLMPVDDRTVAEGDAFLIVLVADDPDGDPLTFRLEGATLPTPGPLLDPATGLVTWVTDYASEGTYPVDFVVSDGRLEARQRATIVVTHVNEPPVVVAVGGVAARGPLPLAFTGHEGAPLELAVVTRDGDGEPVTLSLATAEGVPGRALALVDEAIEWTPGYGDAGRYVLVLTATDPEGASDAVEVLLDILPTNRPPVLSDSGAHVADEGERLEFAVEVADPDGDALAFTVVGDAAGWPAGLAWSPEPGRLRFAWDTDYESAGTRVLLVSADDGHGGTASLPVLVSIHDVNRAPVFDPVPDQHPGGFPGAFTYVVRDPDGDEVRCVPLELPAGAVFDPKAAEVRWPELPAEVDYHARISCSDSVLSSDLDVKVVNRWGDLAGGCGCGGGGGTGVVAGLGAAVLARRRRTVPRLR